MDARPRLLDRVCDHLRKLHYSHRTEQQYLLWIRRFILFHGNRHPACMAAREVEDFLTHLAVDRKVSASTQNQARAAILFLYQKVMQVELPWLDGIVRAKQSRYLPVVLTTTDVRAVPARLKGEYWLVGNLLFGAGPRLSEALQLRVKDIQFEYRQVIVRSAKSAKDRSRSSASIRVRISNGAGVLPHISSLLRDAPARAPLRHSHRSGTARIRGCEDDADLHACHAQGRECGAESFGSVSANATPNEDEKRKKERKRERQRGTRIARASPLRAPLGPLRWQRSAPAIATSFAAVAARARASPLRALLGPLRMRTPGARCARRSRIRNVTHRGRDVFEPRYPRFEFLVPEPQTRRPACAGLQVCGWGTRIRT